MKLKTIIINIKILDIKNNHANDKNHRNIHINILTPKIRLLRVFFHLKIKMHLHYFHQYTKDDNLIFNFFEFIFEKYKNHI